MNNLNISEMREKLERCKKIDIMKVNPDEVDNIEKININKQKSSKERILDFLYFTKNPYIFNVGGCIVKTEFSNSNIYADNCVVNVFKDIYK